MLRTEALILEAPDNFFLQSFQAFLSQTTTYQSEKSDCLSALLEFTVVFHLLNNLLKANGPLVHALPAAKYSSLRSRWFDSKLLND